VDIPEFGAEYCTILYYNVSGDFHPTGSGVIELIGHDYVVNPYVKIIPSAHERARSTAIQYPQHNQRGTTVYIASGPRIL
jgi:hypothetical protein